MIEIFTGDYPDIELKLRRNKAPYFIDPASSVKCALANDAGLLISGPFSCSSATAGADWAHGIVVFQLPAGSTFNLDPRSDLVIQVEVKPVSGKAAKWRTPIRLLKAAF